MGIMNAATIGTALATSRGTWQREEENEGPTQRSYDENSLTDPVAAPKKQISILYPSDLLFFGALPSVALDSRDPAQSLPR